MASRRVGEMAFKVRASREEGYSLEMARRSRTQAPPPGPME